MTNWTPTDDALMARLAAVIERADPVPEAVMEAARVSLTWRTVDAELAELVYDSAVEELAGVRGLAEQRQVTFRSPAIEIAVSVAEGGRRLVGQIVPPQVANIQLRYAEQSHDVTSDEFGRFVFDEVPAGPVSLRCALADGAVVTTDWVVL